MSTKCDDENGVEKKPNAKCLHMAKVRVGILSPLPSVMFGIF